MPGRVSRCPRGCVGRTQWDRLQSGEDAQCGLPDELSRSFASDHRE